MVAGVRLDDDDPVVPHGPAAAGAIAGRPRSLRRVEPDFDRHRLFGGRPGVGCHRRRGSVGGQRVLHRSQQLAAVERLVEQGVAPSVEPLQVHDVVGLAGHEQHAQVGVPRAQADR